MKLRVVRNYALKPGSPVAAPSDLSPDDPLLAFASEETNLPAVRSSKALTLPPKPAAEGISLGQGMVILAAGVALVAVAAGAYQYQQGAGNQSAAVVATGRLVLESTPAGAEVTVDGEPRGITPLALDLSAGPHEVAIRRDADVKTLALTIAAGSERIHHLEFGAAVAAPATAVGHLTVVTDPPGARVSIDGQARGTSPVTINDMTTTRHRVSLSG
jgi:hypothetical protein